MGLFDSFKKNKKKKEVWRDQSEQIVCPGDSCPRECDDTCPIWCQTLGITLLRANRPAEAISEFQKAIAIAPDFKEAWCNLGNAFGSCDKHSDANAAFSHAVDLDPRYINALRGLAISYKNLNMFDKALVACDKLERLGDKEAADNFRHEIRAKQNPHAGSGGKNFAEILIEIISHARKEGFLGPNDKIPHVPELWILREEAVTGITKECINEFDSRENNLPIICLACCIYAGIGAVINWHLDWDSLQKKGIVRTVVEPKGIDDIDDYALGAIGIVPNSAEDNQFRHHLHQLLIWIDTNFLRPMSNSGNSTDFYNLLQAAFLFGTVYEMERLGMK